MKSELNVLKQKLIEINDLNAAGALLSWDQETYMPELGGPARARQMGTVQRIAHEKFVSEEMGDLLSGLMEKIDELDSDSDDAALIRLTMKNYKKSVLIPADRLAAFYEHAANSYQAWARARAEDDFELVAPNLETTLEFSRELAGYFPEQDHIADPLIDMADPGMKVADIKKVFSSLRKDLVPLVAEISEKTQLDDSCLFGHFPESDQRGFGLSVVKRLGFDSKRSRQDKTHHPFMTKFSLNDVRITTRFNDNNFYDGFFSTVHETGHALYELGINQAYDGLPLGNGVSAGLHESQSRLWENLIGRSDEFWRYFFPYAQEAFPAQLKDVSFEAFYAAINKVEPSLLRTESDEVTYNLHVMIRFDLELAMLEGDLAIRDLPAAWHDRYQSDLGVSSPTDANGVLQDVHWYAGLIGGSFQGYTLGNIMSSQIFEKALVENPGIKEDAANGSFEVLHNWLKDNIYTYGSKYEPDELIKRVTGNELDTGPLMRYMRSKFGALYNLD